MHPALLIRRFAAFVVAAHLEVLPAAAALHEASHYRFEAGVALQVGVEPCPDGGARTHRAHLDGRRGHPGDLLCEFLEHAHGKIVLHGGGLVTPCVYALALAGKPGDSFVRPLALALPQSRSPPLFS